MVATDFSALAASSAASSPPPRRGIFGRAFTAIMESRQRKADRDIAEILAWRMNWARFERAELGLPKQPAETPREARLAPRLVARCNRSPVCCPHRHGRGPLYRVGPMETAQGG